MILLTKFFVRPFWGTFWGTGISNFPVLCSQNVPKKQPSETKPYFQKNLAKTRKQIGIFE